MVAGHKYTCVQPVIVKWGFKTPLCLCQTQSTMYYGPVEMASTSLSCELTSDKIKSNKVRSTYNYQKIKTNNKDVVDNGNGDRR